MSKTDNFKICNEFEKTKVIRKMCRIYKKSFDFCEKYAPSNIVPRIRQLWHNIPTQLARKNKKFIYGLVKEGARAREYEIALSWLINIPLYSIANIEKIAI